MIKFFRHIRKSLINDNNMSKYFKYAIGEILLVVIGILIALQINNWNERKQNTLKVDNLLQKILKDIELDLSDIADLTRFYATKDSLANLVLNDKLTKEDYQEPEKMELHFLARNYSEINLRINSYNNLMRYQDIIPKKYDALLEQLYLQYSDQFNFVMQVESRYRDDMDKYKDYLFENYEWNFTQDYLTNTDRINFYLNNVRYKGMVREYQSSAIHNYLRFNIDYAYAAIDTYKQINEVLNNKSIKPLFNFEADSSIFGTYRTLFNEDFELVSVGTRDHVVSETDTVNLFQYASNKFFMQNNFVRFDKVNDSLNFYINAYENGAKPFATKVN